MRRENAAEGIEFGLNDFQPMVRGTRSPSRPSRQPKRGREFVLALVFTCVGALIIAGFHTMKRDSGQELIKRGRQIRTSRISDSRPSAVYAVQNERYPSRNPESYSHSKASVYASLESTSVDDYDDELLNRIRVKMNSLAQRIDEFLDE